MLPPRRHCLRRAPACRDARCCLPVAAAATSGAGSSSLHSACSTCRSWGRSRRCTSCCGSQLWPSWVSCRAAACPASHCPSCLPRQPDACCRLGQSGAPDQGGGQGRRMDHAQHGVSAAAAGEPSAAACHATAAWPPDCLPCRRSATSASAGGRSAISGCARLRSRPGSFWPRCIERRRAGWISRHAWPTWSAQVGGCGLERAIFAGPSVARCTRRWAEGGRRTVSAGKAWPPHPGPPLAYLADFTATETREPSVSREVTSRAAAAARDRTPAASPSKPAAQPTGADAAGLGADGSVQMQEIKKTS